jgi:hypothetical protein
MTLNIKLKYLLKKDLVRLNNTAITKVLRKAGRLAKMEHCASI